jgi:hypothetical protein
MEHFNDFEFFDDGILGTILEQPTTVTPDVTNSVSGGIRGEIHPRFSIGGSKKNNDGMKMI